MNVEQSLNQILHSIRLSNLHFSSQETPHSLYLSIRKKTLNQNSSFLPPAPPSSNCKERDTFKDKCEMLENKIESIRKEFESEISEHKKVFKESSDRAAKILRQTKVIEQLESDNKSLKAENEVLEKDMKNVKRDLKDNNKCVHDVKKHNGLLKETL